jgi:hypothetical protein
MAKLVSEKEAKTFIDSYSDFKVSNSGAITNKLITVARVLEMGGRVVGESTSTKLVDADHLVGYQLPSDKLNSYDFYFASDSGCNLELTLSRRLCSESNFSGIREGSHPTLSFTKNPDASSSDGNIGRHLWDQLDVANKMTLTWINSSASAPRAYLLNMPIGSTTYGEDRKYYYIGQVLIGCGQIGSKLINLYYKTPVTSMTFLVNISNGTGMRMTGVTVMYRITGPNYLKMDNFTIPSLAVRELETKQITASGFTSGNAYTFTIDSVTALESDRGGYQDITKVSKSNCYFPQDSPYIISKYLHVQGPNIE